MFCGAILMGFAGIWMLQLPAGGFSPSAGALATAAVLGSVTAALLARRTWPLGALRVLELAAFGAVTLHLAVLAYLDGIADLSATANHSDGGWNLTLLRFALLAIAYGVFIPNTAKRAAPAVIGMTVTPLLVAALIRASFPEMRAGFDATAVSRMFDTALLLAISSAVAIFAAFVINMFFSAAYESRRSSFYDLEERIGRGGMGEVWKASHRGLARPAAVKLIRQDRIADVDPEEALRVLRRFEREARATARLSSPHTIEVFDAGITADGHFYYAMEYVEGIDLESLVTRFGPLPAERATHLLIQACDSLANAHEQGLVHRDIKPANLLVSMRGPGFDHLKVLDFGLVTSDPDSKGDVKLTTEGTTTGTPAYIAPEMAVGNPVDSRTDIYSLGCVAYWLLTGKTVFQGNNEIAMIVEHVRTPPTPPSARSELPISQDLDEIVLRCLEKQPEKRFQGARELADALARAPVTCRWTPQRAEEWWSLHHRPLEPHQHAAAF